MKKYQIYTSTKNTKMKLALNTDNVRLVQKRVKRFDKFLMKYRGEVKVVSKNESGEDETILSVWFSDRHGPEYPIQARHTVTHSEYGNIWEEPKCKIK